MGQLLRQCSVVLSAVALMFGAAASADWQASSTHDRMVKFGNDMPYESIGPQCSLVMNVGQTDLGTVHKRPRGTLELFIDWETVSHRISEHREGEQTYVDDDGSVTPERYPKQLVDSYMAPVMQIHGINPQLRLDDELFYRYSSKGANVDVVRAAVYRIYYMWTRQDVGSTQVEVRSGVSRVQSPLTDPERIYGTDEPDPTGSVMSAYWVDYPQEIYNAYHDGTLKTLRIYFPGSAVNNANLEQPHYLSWDIDLGMEAANKLCECIRTVAARVNTDSGLGPLLQGGTASQMLEGYLGGPVGPAPSGETCPAPMAVAPPDMMVLADTEYKVP